MNFFELKVRSNNKPYNEQKILCVWWGSSPGQCLALYAMVFLVIFKELFILIKRPLWFRGHSYRIKTKYELLA